MSARIVTVSFVIGLVLLFVMRASPLPVNRTTNTTNSSMEEGHSCNTTFILQDEPVLNISCCNLTAGNSSVAEGVYLIRGEEGGFSSKRVWCAAGGWTVVQRRTNNSSLFKRGWDDYQNGFGDLEAEFWYGLKGLHVLTMTGSWELRVEVNTTDGVLFNSTYSSFTVEGARDGYRLLLGRHTGELDLIGGFHGKKFSTFDKDNNKDNSINCGKEYNVGWWYPSSCRYEDNAILTTTLINRRFAADIRYMDNDVFLATTTMKIRPAVC